MRLPIIGGGIGGIVLLVIALALGADPGTILNGSTNTASYYDGAPISAEEQELADFVSIVLADRGHMERNLRRREP